MIRKKPAPDKICSGQNLLRTWTGGNRFSEKIMLNQNAGAPINSIWNDRALSREIGDD